MSEGGSISVTADGCARPVLTRNRSNAFYSPPSEGSPDSRRSSTRSLHGDAPAQQPCVGSSSTVVGPGSVRIGVAVTQGKRPSMEDSHALVPRMPDGSDGQLYCLFDGHNGADAALLAAEEFPGIFAKELLDAGGADDRTGAVNAALQATFRKSSEAIVAAGIAGGCTALAVFIDGPEGPYYVANAGDCRAVSFSRPGDGFRATALTVDHKPSVSAEEERISRLGGTVTTSVSATGEVRTLVAGQLAVSRALGDSALQPFVSHEPDVFGPFDTSGARADAGLILACDGLWDEVNNEAAGQMAAEAVSPEKAAQELRDLAWSFGSTDNISVLVISFS